ncbi:MAG TPA: double zinc ribbon domain-containing protein, partial [Syntrophales bacterium]|nr:double zinc ribbon domain-containing protein [Syntrophales bacterium]
MMICEAKEIVTGIADILFPPTCPVCGTVLINEKAYPFCPECLSTIHLTIPPLCTSCGLQFAATEGENHLCEECIVSPPPFSIARSLGKYETALLDAIHLFKYHGRISVGEALGRMMATDRYDSLEIPQYSLLIPVPLHPKRLRERGFNQSLIL